jgi:hypothetical protein
MARTVCRGTVAVTDGRLVIGDAGFPPVGTEIRAVPNGEFEVTAVVTPRPGGEAVTSFGIAFGGDGTETQTFDFSIDGGVVAVADPAVEVPGSWLERRRVRWEVRRQITRGLKGVPPGLYFDTLTGAAGKPWAVVFHAGDGIYDVNVRRREGRVTELSCRLRSK